MATSNKIFVSPGVYTSERDLSFVAQSVGVTTLGIVGETITGPAFEPIFITNFDEFQAYFGPTSPEKFVNTQIPKYEAAYIAKSYLQQSNQLFVTRVLGLSGYDAGPSWTISTIANINSTTVFPSGGTGSYVWTAAFTGTSATTSSIEITSGLPSVISDIYTIPYTQNTGSQTTLSANMNTQLFAILNNNSLQTSSVYVYGAVPQADYNNINSSFNLTNVFNVQSMDFGAITKNSYLNDAWYYALFTTTPVVNGYSGFSYFASVSALNYNSGSDTFSGTVSGMVYNYSGTSWTEYDNMVVGTLRSRGVSTYTSSNAGPLYQLTGETQLTIDYSGTYSAMTEDPYATFAISGNTIEGDTFSFETSFNDGATNYISKVFGTTNFGKDREEVPVFLEERFQNLLNWSYAKGYIRGLNTSFTALPSAREDNSTNTSIGWYLEEYQTPATPYLVSELRGNTVYRLFRFITVSDGNSANREVKVSIANISFANGTFDVGVRDFFDTDENPVFLERYTNCSMDPTQNNFIAKKIGTSDGEYELKSRFVMVEMNPDAPVDALPCGFEGYTFREYGGSGSDIQPPFAIYKTKYNTPGEVIFTPPFSLSSGADNLTRSSGDKVRKTYLGFSTQIGIDANFFDYKGKQNPSNLGLATSSTEWNYMTKGFHMDSGATIVAISGNFVTSGQSAFECGITSFRTEPTSSSNPYYTLASRKFTVIPKGGFDGWDIYREYRTNGDIYSLGNTGYLYGASDENPNYPLATGWGAFKQITKGNDTELANTDYYAYLLGQETFANPEAVNINVFVTPGIDYVNNSNLVENAIDLVETDRADSIYICTTPDVNMYLNYADSTTFIYPQEAVDSLEETGIDSNYTATYYPWILTRDSVNNTQIYLPVTGEVTRNLALTDNIAFPWFAAAGYTRGLVNAVKARKKLTQEDRDTLYQGRINPIATFSDVGTVIWGNKTLQIRESALDRINVRRLLLQARKLISAVAVRLLFEQNDDKVRQQFLDSVNPILDSIRRDRGLYDFRVTVSSSPEDLDRNTLTGKIYLKPTRALEFIDIEFLITPTGASFENI